MARLFDVLDYLLYIAVQIEPLQRKGGVNEETEQLYWRI
jgi:hypothetical protein